MCQLLGSLAVIGCVQSLKRRSLFWTAFNYARPGFRVFSSSTVRARKEDNSRAFLMVLEQTKLVETKDASGKSEIGLKTASPKKASSMTNENKRGRSNASDEDTKKDDSKNNSGEILHNCNIFSAGPKFRHAHQQAVVSYGGGTGFWVLQFMISFANFF